MTYYNSPELQSRARNSLTPEVSAERYSRLQKRINDRTTSKACHGCGEDSQYRDWRPLNDVCGSCLLKMWDGEDYIASQRVAQNKGEFERLLIPVNRWSKNSPAFPSWGNPAYSFYREARIALDQFEIASADLFNIFIEPLIVEKNASSWRTNFDIPHRAVPIGNYYSDCPRNAVHAPPGTGDLIQQFSATGQSMIDAMFAAGVDRGKSIISQLAAGDITNDQFEKAK